MNTYDPDTLLEFSATLIEAMGSPRENALIVARHLVEAQLAGHASVSYTHLTLPTSDLV